MESENVSIEVNMINNICTKCIHFNCIKITQFEEIVK